MINLEFLDAKLNRVGMAYDVHPASQAAPIPLPEGAAYVVVWLGTK